MSIIAANFTLLSHRYKYPEAALYTETEVNTMITTQDYIPVASAAELNALRNSVTQIMGAGTPWQANYVTGVGKKYVQVTNNIEFHGYSSIQDFSGIYDGNHLNISRDRNYIFKLTGATLRNIYVSPRNNSIEINSLLAGVGATPAFAGSNYIDNCHGIGDFNTTFAGLVNANRSSNELIITNCSYTGNLTAIADSVGLIIGDANNCTIENCTAVGNISGGTNIGGITGEASSSTISNCQYSGNITSNRIIGGIAGIATNSTIEECLSNGTYISNNGASTNSAIGGIVGYGYPVNIINCYSTADVEGNGKYIGGLSGYVRGASVVTNSYSTGYITEVGTLTYVGGLLGRNDGVVTNSYWDMEASGQATSDGGTGKTTLEMKEGLIDDPDTDGIYVGWDDTIWDEGTASEYPTLINVD
jgi:hypothetical protein